jgi:hypothetical protein
MVKDVSSSLKCFYFTFTSRGNYQDGVPDEENGCVVANQIPVAIFCVEFHGETSWVTCCVCRSALTAYNRELCNIPKQEVHGPHL